MSQFLYFIPDANAADDALLKRVGLEHLLGAPRRQGRIDRGPGGGPGCLVTLGPKSGDGPDVGDGPPSGLSWLPDAQEWPECPDAGFRIGFTKGLPPQPRDLARADLIDGHAVTLEDGNEWVVPIGRVFGLGGARYRRLRIGPGGRVVGGAAIARLEAVERDAERFWRTVFPPEKKAPEDPAAAPVMTDEEQAEAAVRALAVNYRIGRYEAMNALGLLTEENVARVLLALIDGPRLTEALKKNGPLTPSPGPSSASSGGGA